MTGSYLKWLKLTGSDWLLTGKDQNLHRIERKLTESETKVKTKWLEITLTELKWPERAENLLKVTHNWPKVTIGWPEVTERYRKWTENWTEINRKYRKLTGIHQKLTGSDRKMNQYWPGVTKSFRTFNQILIGCDQKLPKSWPNVDRIEMESCTKWLEDYVKLLESEPMFTKKDLKWTENKR